MVNSSVDYTTFTKPQKGMTIDMLLSLALLFLLGLILGGVCNRLKLPPLLGMLVTGMLLGPSGLGLLDPGLLAISPDLRSIALIIILTRAGLNLDLADLKKVGRPAVLICFLPACFEIVGMVVLAPALLGVTVLEAAILGSVVAAVSPAVIVPKMLKIMEEGYGQQHSIPQMIMAGASVDDVFVIVLFTSFTGLAATGILSPMAFARIPSAILLGAASGVLCGLGLAALFARVGLRDSAKVLVLLSVSFLLVVLEEGLTGTIGFSGLIGVMAMGITLQKKRPALSGRLSAKYSKLWVAAELLLFVLVGSDVNLSSALAFGPAAVLLLALVVCVRMLGVLASLLGTELSWREKLFCMIAYCPKATVQAAIGAVPLAMGLPCGQLVLTVAVLAILLTAPLGAFAIDLLYKRLLPSASITPDAG